VRSIRQFAISCALCDRPNVHPRLHWMGACGGTAGRACWEGNAGGAGEPPLSPTIAGRARSHSDRGRTSIVEGNDAQMFGFQAARAEFAFIRHVDGQSMGGVGGRGRPRWARTICSGPAEASGSDGGPRWLTVIPRPPGPAHAASPKAMDIAGFSQRCVTLDPGSTRGHHRIGR